LVPKEVEKFSGTIQGIKFAFGKATIRRVSFKILDEAVAVLQKYPDIRLEVQGHTDSVGPDDLNSKLSNDRAVSVARYLASLKGGYRIRYTGYGESRPIASNETIEGRAINRRVDLEVTARKIQ